MQRDRHTRLESFSARESDPLELDDHERYSQRHSVASPAKPRNLTLQIAFGIWLGGTALMVTAWVLGLVLPHLPMVGLPSIGAAAQQEVPLHPAPRK